MSCGNSTSQSVRMGISVGWMDIYSAYITHQWIDISDLPEGDYRLCATVNPSGLWTEKLNNFANNSHWIDVHLDPAAETATPISDGEGPC
jgi:hypothetical protein